MNSHLSETEPKIIYTTGQLPEVPTSMESCIPRASMHPSTMDMPINEVPHPMPLMGHPGVGMMTEDSMAKYEQQVYNEQEMSLVNLNKSNIVYLQ